MPASLFPDMDRSGGPLEDQRALQLALELSMLGLNNENDTIGGSYENEPRNKKSQNTTECVPVPSSEHVAEIVGRQGCKIKALRAKTNTYIKTPVRGEEPVFVVTGRKEDVNAAKREILSAAEHFSQIRAQRKNNLNGSLVPGPNSNIPGQTTIQVRVPYRVVGLVVGPKGATIKRIQQQTNTYIVTPSRDKEPVFEVTGLPDNVESARKEIEAHIAMRTGSMIDSVDENDFNSNTLDPAAFTNNLNAANSALFKTDISNGFISPFSRDSNNLLDPRTPESIFTFPAPTTDGSPKLTDVYSTTTVFTNGFTNGFGLYDVDEGLGESPTFDAPMVPLTSATWPEFGTSSLTDTGSLFSTTSVNSTTTLTTLTQRSNSISGALSDLVLGDHPPARRIRSDPLTNAGGGTGGGGVGNGSVSALPTFTPVVGSTTNEVLISGFPANSSSGSVSVASSPTDSVTSGRKPKRDCVVCYESEVVAALVPCGHNLFCLECANRICEKNDSECPICRQPASQAIRIYS